MVQHKNEAEALIGIYFIIRWWKSLQIKIDQVESIIDK